MYVYSPSSNCANWLFVVLQDEQGPAMDRDYLARYDAIFNLQLGRDVVVEKPQL